MGFFSKVGEQEEYPVTSEIASIQFEGFNGAIQWLPVDGGEERVVVEKEVRGLNPDTLQEVLERIIIENTSSQGKLVLKAKCSHRPLGLFNVQVRFTVYASPEKIRDFQATTSNGAITVDVPYSGRLQLRTANGRIVLRSGSGQVDITTSNGRIELGKLVFQGSSRIRTSNGSISGQVEFSQDGSYSFQTSNGSIELRVPNSTPGMFQATTSHGSIQFLLGEERYEGRKHVRVERSASPSVDISTSNGSIDVIGYGLTS